MTKTEAINYCKGKNRWTANGLMTFAERLIEENSKLQYGRDIFYLEILPREMAIKKYYTNKYVFSIVEKLPVFNWMFAYRTLSNDTVSVEQKFILVNNLKELEYKIIELLAE